jgi:glyoxylase-like metal-dependent hydrolase (beta-lactamase superfamily II)
VHGARDIQAAGRATLTERPEPAYERVPRPAEGAHARELADGVWSLQLPLCYRAVASLSAYLIRDRNGYIVWDCGSCLDPGWAAMEIALGQAKVRPRDVSTLVVSHAHTDHRGLAAEFVDRTGARLLTSSEPHPMLDVIREPVIDLEIRRERARHEGVPDFAVDGIVDELPGMDNFYPHAEPDVVLMPGDAVDSDVGRWEVLALPGHGADQIGMFNRRLGFLLSADLAFPGVASYLEYGNRPDPHADQLASLDRAIALEPEVLLPGHGRPAPDAVTVLRHCRAQVMDRVDRVLAVLDAGPASGWDVAVALTPSGALNDHYQRSLSEALCVLEHLERTGRVTSVHDAQRRRSWLPAGA